MSERRGYDEITDPENAPSTATISIQFWRLFGPKKEVVRLYSPTNYDILNLPQEQVLDLLAGGHRMGNDLLNLSKSFRGEGRKDLVDAMRAPTTPPGIMIGTPNKPDPTTEPPRKRSL